MDNKNHIEKKSYTFTIKAWWSVNGESSITTLCEGVLALTHGGRIEFTLDGGKVLFSAPVCLIRYKFGNLFKNVAITVGPHQYTLRLYPGKTSNILISNVLMIAEANLPKAAQSFDTLKESLDQHANDPVDNFPIIAAAPKAIHKAALVGFIITQMSLVLSVIGIFIAAFLIATGKISLVTLDFLKLPLLIAFPILFYILFRKRNTLKKIDPVTLPEETFPPGTKPTATFDSGERRMFYWFILSALLFVAFFFVFYLVTK